MYHQIPLSKIITDIYNQDKVYVIDNPTTINQSSKKQGPTNDLQDDYLKVPQFSELSLFKNKLNFIRFFFSWVLKPFDEQTWKKLAKDFLITYEYKKITGDGRGVQLNQNRVEQLCDDADTTQHKFIKEYIKSSDFYRILNDSLRTKNSIEFLSNLRWVFSKLYKEISDLGNTQLEELREKGEQNYSIKVYRGIGYLSDKEKKMMRKKQKNPNQNFIFQFEGFVSTSANIKKALDFGGKYLIQIHINILLRNSQSEKDIKGKFADLRSPQLNLIEEQILFTPLCYFLFKSVEKEGEIHKLIFEYIDVGAIFDKEKKGEELKDYEKKVLQSYKHTQLIMNSEIQNQGGLYFVEGNFEKYFKYHSKAAQMAMKQIPKDHPNLKQDDDLIIKLIIKYQALLKQIIRGFFGVPNEDNMKKIVYYLKQHYKVSKTYTCSFLDSYFLHKKCPLALQLKVQLLMLIKQKTQYNLQIILITLVTGLQSDLSFMKEKYDFYLQQLLKETKNFSFRNQFFFEIYKQGPKYIGNMRSRIVSRKQLSSPFIGFVGIYFKAFEYTVNVWVAKGVTYYEILNSFYSYFSVLVDSCRFEKAEQIFQKIEAIQQKKREQYEIEKSIDLFSQSCKKKQDEFNKIRIGNIALLAHFYTKYFLNMPSSQQKYEYFYKAAQQHYHQLLSQQNLSKYHSYFCQQQSHDPQCQSYMIQKIKINLARLYFHKTKEHPTQYLKELFESNHFYIRLQACLLSEDTGALIDQWKYRPPLAELTESSIIPNLLEYSQTLSQIKGHDPEQIDSLNNIIYELIGNYSSFFNKPKSHQQLSSVYKKQKWSLIFKIICEFIKNWLGKKETDSRMERIILKELGIKGGLQNFFKGFPIEKHIYSEKITLLSNDVIMELLNEKGLQWKIIQKIENQDSQLALQLF